MEARVLRLATQPPALALSLHAMPLSNPLFDNYLLCCLGQGWGHHTYITDTKTLPTHVCPPLFDLYRSSPLKYTENTQDYRTTRWNDQMVVSQVLLLGEHTHYYPTCLSVSSSGGNQESNLLNMVCYGSSVSQECSFAHGVFWVKATTKCDWSHEM